MGAKLSFNILDLHFKIKYNASIYHALERRPTEGIPPIRLGPFLRQSALTPTPTPSIMQDGLSASVSTNIVLRKKKSALTGK